MDIGNWYKFGISMAALVICITIHEFSHAYSAYRAGDDTPRMQGRISLNPIDHLDLFGTIMMVISSLSGYGFGWGKPVQINPANFKHPRWDNLRTSLWGPLSNLITAAVVGLALRFLYSAAMNTGTSISFAKSVAGALPFLGELTRISIVLAVFNLIPIAPLDGSHILSALLPYELARRYDFFMARYGMLIFFALIFLGSGGGGCSILCRIIGPPANFLWSLIVGWG